MGGLVTIALNSLYLISNLVVYDALGANHIDTINELLSKAYVTLNQYVSALQVSTKSLLLRNSVSMSSQSYLRDLILTADVNL